MDSGGERVKEHSAEGQRMHRDRAQFSRRTRQGIRVEDTITVGSINAPVYLDSRQVIVCSLLVWFPGSRSRWSRSV